MPRTIDNLGMESSSRYAEDQKRYDASLAKEAAAIPLRTEIDVTSPAFSSEWEKIFGLDTRTILWADFHPPAKYHEQKKRLFTFQIIPSLGSEEKNEAQTEKVSALIPLLEEKFEKREDKERKKAFTYAWEEEREKEDEKKEKAILLRLLHCISNLDKHLIEVNSRRGQYQKG